MSGAPVLDARWYLPEYEKERHTRISQVVGRIWDAQNYRRDELLRNARLYGNLPLLGLGPRSYAKRNMTSKAGRLSFNVIKACVDTYAAKLTKEKPKVSFVTSGADWGLQEKAKKLEKFVDGQFYESDLYQLASRVVLDTGVFGSGFVKPYIDWSNEEEPRIAIDRVLPWELLVDDEEAAYDNPRTIYQRKWIDRRVLSSMFEENEDDIDECGRSSTATDDDDYGYDSTADQLLVTEAWHVRSGKNAKDGRHCIIIDNATLLDEEWEYDWLPIVPLRRQPPLVGYWGVGIADDLIGLQYEINVLLDKIRKSYHLLGAGKWLVQKGSINKQKLDNDIGAILEYMGTPPTLTAGPVVSPEIYQHLDRLYAKAFELSGISQQAAQSLKPPGIVSGEGLRVYSDISTERFTVNFREYQQWFLNIARRLIDLAGELSKEHPKFAVKAVGRSAMAHIVFKDSFLDRNDYVMQLYPTNALAKDPASRIEQVKAFADAGWLDQAAAKRLLDFPDLEAEASYENASYDLVQDIIERMKEERYIAPEPMVNLEDAIKWVQLAYLKYKRDTLDDEDQDRVERVLELLRRWLVDASALLNPPPPEPEQAPPGAEGPPPPPGAGPPPMPGNGPMPGPGGPPGIPIPPPAPNGAAGAPPSPMGA